jgi:hypothetical protein
MAEAVRDLVQHPSTYTDIAAGGSVECHRMREL